MTEFHEPSNGGSLSSALEDLLACEGNLWDLRVREVASWNAISPAGSSGQIAEVAPLVEQVLDRRRERVRGLLHVIVGTGSALEDARAASVEATKALDMERKRFASAEAKAASALSKDPRFAALDAQKLALADAVSANRNWEGYVMPATEARLAEFENDPVFRYLLSRNFGTKDYRAGLLRRLLDVTVARWAGFDRQLAAYDAVRAYPEEHAARAAAAAEEAAVELAKIEPRRKALRESIRRGLDGYRTKLADALNAAAEADEGVDRVGRQVSAARAGLRSAVSGQDEETRMITEAIVTMLAKARAAAADAEPEALALMAGKSEHYMKARLSIARAADEMRVRAISLLEGLDGGPASADAYNDGNRYGPVQSALSS